MHGKMDWTTDAKNATHPLPSKHGLQWLRTAWLPLSSAEIALFFEKRGYRNLQN